MKLLRNLLAAWRMKRPDGTRRVIILGLAGLEISRVDQYLDEGLLHYLALLSDVGSRTQLDGADVFDAVSVVEKLRAKGQHASALTKVSPARPVNLNSLCVADRTQQERLIAALRRRRPQVVVCEFDMLAQLNILCGPQPNADQQLILRDVYARMDENVGKSLSFVDETTALLVVITPQPQSLDVDISAQKCELFASCRLGASDNRSDDLASMVLGLLHSGRVHR